MRARTAAALLCAAVLAAAAVPRAAASSNPLLDPQAYNDFLQDIFGELRSLNLISGGSAPADAAAAKRRSLLTTFDPLGSVQDFFTHILGGNWTDHLPSSWSLPSFDWAKLGTFEYTNNLQDFVQNVNLTKPASLAELHETLAEAESAFCTEEKFVPSFKVPASCEGPSVTLAFVPKVCVLDADNKAVVCDPAKLVLAKTPGACTHSYHSASTWKGKECKIGGTVGFAKAVVKGGDAYAVPLKTISVHGFDI